MTYNARIKYKLTRGNKHMPIINNGGRGNCGPEALAIGLIDIIQNESIRGRQVFENLIAIDFGEGLPLRGRLIEGFRLLKEGADLDDEKLNEQLYLVIMDLKLEDLPRGLLNDLQLSLRGLCVKTYLNGLEHELDGSKLFNRFRELVLFQEKLADFNRKNHLIPGLVAFIELLQAPPSIDTVHQSIETFISTLDAQQRATHEATIREFEAKLRELTQFNPLVFSAELMNTAKDVALALDPSEDDDLTSVIESFVSAKTQQNIRDALERVKQDGIWWFTDEDLTYTAHALNVNLMVRGKPSQPDPGNPTITLVNQGNYHWVTHVDKWYSYPKFFENYQSAKATKELSLASLPQAVQTTLAAEIRPDMRVMDEEGKILESIEQAYQACAGIIERDLPNPEEKRAALLLLDEHYATVLQDAEVKRARGPR